MSFRMNMSFEEDVSHSIVGQANIYDPHTLSHFVLYTTQQIVYTLMHDMQTQTICKSCEIEWLVHTTKIQYTLSRQIAQMNTYSSFYIIWNYNEKKRTVAKSEFVSLEQRNLCQCILIYEAI